jgi:hypothetical protein
MYLTQVLRTPIGVGFVPDTAFRDSHCKLPMKPPEGPQPIRGTNGGVWNILWMVDVIREITIRRVDLLLVFVLTLPLWAQPPEILVRQPYPENGRFLSIVPSDTVSPPRYYVLGGSGVQGGIDRCYVVKVDAAGDPQWNRLLGNHDNFTTMIPWGRAVLIGGWRIPATQTLPDCELMQVGPTGFPGSTYTFGGNTTSDIPFGMVQYPAGWLFMTGRVSASTSGPFDASLIRVSVSGDVSWARTYTSGQSGRALAMDGDSVLFIYGTADSIDAAQARDFLLIRTDTLGVANLTRRFGGPENEDCFDAVRVSSDLTIMVGTSVAAGPGLHRTSIFVLATNDNGDSLWSRTWGSLQNNVAYAVTQTTDQDSGFVVAGWTENRLTARSHGLLMKFARTGDSLWSILDSDTSSSRFYDVLQDSLCQYRIAGQLTTDTDHGLYWITEPDLHSPGTHRPTPFSLLMPANDGLMTEDTVEFSWEPAINPDGDGPVRYTLTIANDSLFSTGLIQAPVDTTVYRLACRSDDNERKFWRITAVTHDSLARICREGEWSFRISIPDLTLPFNLAFPDSGVYLGGLSGAFRWYRAIDPDPDDTVSYAAHFETADTMMSFEGLRDTFITVNFGNYPAISVHDTIYWYVIASSLRPQMEVQSQERWPVITGTNAADGPVSKPHAFALSTAFPNPFNSTTVFRFSLDRTDEVRLEIFDVQGRRVTVLVDGLRTAGDYEINWDGSAQGIGVPSGNYFARLSAGARQRTTRVTLLR